MRNGRYENLKTLFIILFGLFEMSLRARASSLDTWTSQFSGTTNNLNAVVYAAPVFAAVGNGGTILTSSNSIDWASQNSGTTNNLYGITRANGLFVAVGQGPIRTSPDGVAWVGHVAPLSVLHGVTYGRGLFVAVGVSGTIGTSSNGTNWFAQSSGAGSTTLWAVTYANGLFVATGGAAPVILTSTNGTNWTSVNPGTGVSGLLGTAFGRDRFVAVGGGAPAARGGSITISQDGMTWSRQNSGITLENFYGVSWGNGSFVAVGGNGGFGGPGYTNRIILTSSDGSSWGTRIADTNSSLAGVAYGNGSFVAVGSGGAVLQSGPIFTLAATNQSMDGGFELALTGEVGRSYRIQASTDLAGTNWTDVANFTNTDETVQFPDPQATNYTWRYYRAVSP
jgi:hypothetical protein